MLHLAPLESNQSACGLEPRFTYLMARPPWTRTFYESSSLLGFRRTYSPGSYPQAYSSSLAEPHARCVDAPTDYPRSPTFGNELLDPLELLTGIEPVTFDLQRRRSSY